MRPFFSFELFPLRHMLERTSEAISLLPDFSVSADGVKREARYRFCCVDFSMTVAVLMLTR
jgi:hypothetical protein